MSLWGYNAQATEDALRVIARSVTERDVEIATLRRELAELRGDPDGARAAGIGGPRVSSPAPVGLPGRAGPAYRPGLPGQAGPFAGDNDPASTITSVPGGQAHDAGLPGAPGQADPPGHAGTPGQADPPGQAGVPGPAEQPSQASVPGQANPPGQAKELPFWAWQRERGADD
jgi:hypothetical protein